MGVFLFASWNSDRRSLTTFKGLRLDKISCLLGYNFCCKEVPFETKNVSWKTDDFSSCLNLTILTIRFQICKAINSGRFIRTNDSNNKELFTPLLSCMIPFSSTGVIYLSFLVRLTGNLKQTFCLQECCSLLRKWNLTILDYIFLHIKFCHLNI